MDSQGGSVTRLIAGVQAGQDSATQKLWEAYFQRLVGLARAKMQGAMKRAADEEDVALSAFASFCRGVETGKFPNLADRDNLWRLLLTITTRKAAHLRRDDRRLKRGGDRVLDEAALAPSSDNPMDAIVGPEPTPELAAQMAEEYERLLAQLDGPGLRQIAILKMEGYTTPEIAVQLDCAPRTVDRRLQLIRDIWSADES